MRITAFEYGLLDCGYLSPKVYDVVKAFIELARTECDIAIVLLRSKFLLSAGSLGLRKQERFKVLSLSAISTHDLCTVCILKGHLSDLFLDPNNYLSTKFLELEYYGPGRAIKLGTHDSSDPIEPGFLSLQTFLNSDEAGNVNSLVAFSHDAAQFYRIFPLR